MIDYADRYAFTAFMVFLVILCRKSKEQTQKASSPKVEDWQDVGVEKILRPDFGDRAAIVV